MKTLSICLLGLSLFLVSCQDISIPQTPAISSVDYSTHPKHAEYLNYLTTYQQQTQTPGAALLVAKAEQPLWAGAVGMSNLEHNTPFSTETQFRIGSITKVFVSTIMLQLVQEEKLRLDDKLAVLLPEIAADIPQSDRITVRQLLAHTSGIVDPPNQSLQYQTDIVNNPVRMQQASGRERLKQYVVGKALLFEPGSNYSYSNPGYWLLELIAEKVTGQKLPQLLAAKLLNPLKLTQTYLAEEAYSEIVEERPARGYTITTTGKVRDVTAWDKAEGTGNAAGGMVSTAGDLHRFYTALFGGQIIVPTLLAEMQKQQLANCNGFDCEYGLGLEIWHIAGKTGYGHNGALIGIEANALYFPETKTTIVLFKNLGGGSDKSFLDNLVR